MLLTRKILAPLLFLFAVLIAGLFAYIYSDYRAETEVEERRDQSELTASFRNEVEHQKTLALTLALEAANDPDLQAAFASGDREDLIKLASPSFEKVKELNVTHYSFYVSPATTFLRLDAPEFFGDDLSARRPIVVEALQERRALSGLEVDEHGLAAHALAPVFHKTQFVGAVEIGIVLNDRYLEQLKEARGNEWRILIPNAILEEVGAHHETAHLETSPLEALALYSATFERPIFNSPENYAAALNGKTTAATLRFESRTYFIVTVPIADYSGKIIGALDVVHDKTANLAELTNRLILVALVGAAALALTALILMATTRKILAPIHDLTTATSQMAAGDFSLEIQTQSKDEIGALANSFNRMSNRLQELVHELERRVEERTQTLELRSLQLETIAQVARDIATVRDLDTLLTLTARLIQERFGYYHAGIFLLDERAEYAVLRAAHSKAAQAMLEQRHKLKVGETGIVGYVANSGLPRIAQDVGADAVHFRNPFLPETRSEIGLPLRSRGLTIGVLDIQATDPFAFSQENVETLQLLADQLVSAIENAQLVKKVETTLSELNAVYQTRTREAWQQVVRSREHASLEYDGLQVKPITRPLPVNVVQRLENGKVVVLEKFGKGANLLVAPLMALNQLIGVVGIEREDPNRPWTEEEIALAQTAADRAAIALENARLLEDAQQRAVKEQTISEVTTKIANTINMRNVLQTAVEELGRALPGAEVTIRMGGNNDHV